MILEKLFKLLKYIQNLNLESNLFKLVLSLLMCILTFGYKDIKYTIKNFIFLYLVSIVLGGAMYLLNIEFSYKNNGLIFYHNGMSINIILILIISPILLYFYIKEMKDLKNNYSKYYKVDIYFKSNKNILLNGFLDTGNNLIDPYKKRPIVIVNYDKIKKYVSHEKELLVPYTNINNEDIMRCIKVKKIVIDDIEYKNVLIGFSFNKINIDGIDCILNNNMEGLC